MRSLRCAPGGSARKARATMSVVCLFARGRGRWGRRRSPRLRVAEEPLGLRGRGPPGLDLDGDAAEHRGRGEVPAFSEGEAVIGVDRVSVVSLVDEPPRRARRGAGPVGGAALGPGESRARFLHRAHRALGCTRRILGDGHDRPHPLPSLIASGGRRRPLRAQRELAGAMKRILARAPRAPSPAPRARRAEARPRPGRSLAALARRLARGGVDGARDGRARSRRRRARSLRRGIGLPRARTLARRRSRKGQQRIPPGKPQGSAPGGERLECLPQRRSVATDHLDPAVVRPPGLLVAGGVEGTPGGLGHPPGVETLVPEIPGDRVRP